jgi:hypothetical protein
MGLAFKLDSPVEKPPLFISTDIKEEEGTDTERRKWETS